MLIGRRLSNAAAAEVIETLLERDGTGLKRYAGSICEDGETGDGRWEETVRELDRLFLKDVAADRGEGNVERVGVVGVGNSVGGTGNWEIRAVVSADSAVH